MFISLNFPVADFRSLHAQKLGRLSKPHWGKQDPRADFARGFGAIHTRSKPGIGYVGENYYADCNQLVRYPKQFFLTAVHNSNRKILSYPIYRRFYFDGLFSGRFELGFRLNEASVGEISQLQPEAKFDTVCIANQFLDSEIQFKFLDGRDVTCKVSQSGPAFRDAYLMSSTENKKLIDYPIHEIGKTYVNVGAPFVIIRSSAETPIVKTKESRELIDIGGESSFILSSISHRRSFNTLVIPSKYNYDNEQAKERMLRLIYTQFRVLIFAHSFFLDQVDEGKFPNSDCLDTAITSMIKRISELSPLEQSQNDAETCETIRIILEKSDIDLVRLAAEITRDVRKGWLHRKLGGIFKFMDNKLDKAIEAAASSATKQVMRGGF